MRVSGPSLALASFPGRNGRIAYFEFDSKTQLNTINPDGSDDRPLPAFGPEAGLLVWSPDGRRVLYTRNFDIWSADPDGAHQQLVIGGDTRDASPAWSPDGSQILFVRTDSGNHLVFDGKNRDP